MGEELKKLFNTNRKYSLNQLCKILKHYEKEKIKQELDNLELNGDIIYSNEKYQTFPSNFELVNIKIDKNGCGYFYLNNKKYEIKNKYLNGCFDGDLCAINMDAMSVSKIIKRKSNLILCEIQNNKAIIINNNQNYEVILSETDYKKLVEGNVFLVRIKENDKNEIYCDLVEVLGHINDPDIELKEIAISKSFDINFSKQAIKEADEIPNEVLPEELENRLDLRDELIYTIDCDETKDMDDAICDKINEKGNYVVGIHIADVSHYIKYGTQLFEEALSRSTSVYMLDTVIPMLMHILSNGICSLNPNVDRLTLSCIVELDKEGNIVDYSISKSAINSKKKMNYSSVNKILMEDTCPEGYEDYVENLKLANEVSLLLSKVFKNDGYLQFGTNEIKYTDEKGFDSRKSLAAEKIIEMHMLLANKVIATHFEYLPFPFRIHEFPEQKEVEKTFEILRKMGYDIPHILNLENQKSIQGILKKLYESGDFSLTSYFVLKSMKKAKYSPINVGHFGLAFDCYTHFTSPIRRFNDLLVHTIISSYLDSNEELILELSDRLPEICEYISEKEVLADEAEEEALKYKMAKYMEDYIGEYFNGKVIDLGPKFITVKLENNIIGTVHLDDIKDGVYYFDNNTYSVINRKSKKSYKIGDYIRTKVINADSKTRQINFKITENLEHVKIKNLEMNKAIN